MRTLLYFHCISPIPFGLAVPAVSLIQFLGFFQHYTVTVRSNPASPHVSVIAGRANMHWCLGNHCYIAAFAASDRYVSPAPEIPVRLPLRVYLHGFEILVFGWQYRHSAAKYSTSRDGQARGETRQGLCGRGFCGS